MFLITYTLYSHSLRNIQTTILEETFFYLLESQHRCNILRCTNTQQSSLKEMFLLWFRLDLTANSYVPVYGWKYFFLDSPKRAFLNYYIHVCLPL